MKRGWWEMIHDSCTPNSRRETWVGLGVPIWASEELFDWSLSSEKVCTMLVGELRFRIKMSIEMMSFGGEIIN